MNETFMKGTKEWIDEDERRFTLWNSPIHAFLKCKQNLCIIPEMLCSLKCS